MFLLPPDSYYNKSFLVVLVCLRVARVPSPPERILYQFILGCSGTRPYGLPVRPPSPQQVLEQFIFAFSGTRAYSFLPLTLARVIHFWHPFLWFARVATRVSYGCLFWHQCLWIARVFPFTPTATRVSHCWFLWHPCLWVARVLVVPLSSCRTMSCGIPRRLRSVFQCSLVARVLFLPSDRCSTQRGSGVPALALVLYVLLGVFPHEAFE